MQKLTAEGEELTLLTVILTFLEGELDFNWIRMLTKLEMSLAATSKVYESLLHIMNKQNQQRLLPSDVLQQALLMIQRFHGESAVRVLPVRQRIFTGFGQDFDHILVELDSQKNELINEKQSKE